MLSFCCQVQQSFLFYTLGTRQIPAAFAVHMHTHADKDAIARMHTHKCTHTHSKSHKYTHIRACTHKTHIHTNTSTDRIGTHICTHTHLPPLPTRQPFHTCGHVGWLDTATPLRVKLAIAQSMLSRIFCKGQQQKGTEQLHVLRSYESTTGWLGTAIGLPVYV